MIKLPSKIQVLGRTYKIIRKLSPTDPYYGTVHGLFNSENNTIYVNKDLDYENAWCTFLHEWQHAMDFNNGLVFTNVNQEVLEMHAETNSYAMWQLLDQLDLLP